MGWGGGGVEVELLVFNENRGGRHVVIDQRTGINKFNEVRKWEKVLTIVGTRVHNEETETSLCRFKFKLFRPERK